MTRDLTAGGPAEDRPRDRTEELLAANAQLDQFRRLVASVRDYAIFMLDPQGRIATWNAGAQHLKGYAPEEVIGRHFSLFYTAEDRERDHPADELRIAAAEGRYEEEGWRVRKDASTFWASVTITAVRGEDGELIGYGKVTRDLTARREAELALQEVNRELDRFASVAAHDLSDPLRTISGFAQLLEREELSEQGREFLTHIGATAARMQRLVDDLLAYARAGRARTPSEPVGLRAAAEQAIAGLRAAAEEHGAEVRLDIPHDARVVALRGDVEQVLQNLIANALKFGPPGDAVVEVSAEPDGDCWRTTVADNGAGILPEDQQRIFQAFERGHAGVERGGAGLGLAIANRLVERHGGRVGLESQPGQGSRFWVLLPAVATA